MNVQKEGIPIYAMIKDDTPEVPPRISFCSSREKRPKYIFLSSPWFRGKRLYYCGNALSIY